LYTGSPKILPPGTLEIMGWLVVVLVSLATFRITRLLIKDTIPVVKVPRDTLVGWLDPDDEYKIEWLAKHGTGREPPSGHLGALGRTLAYLVTCPWCMSVWVGAAVTYATTLYASVPLPWLTWIAACAVTGLLSVLDSD
jgi:hypothetical protein